jgi:hypothetical protein
MHRPDVGDCWEMLSLKNLETSEKGLSSIEPLSGCQEVREYGVRMLIQAALEDNSPVCVAISEKREREREREN